MLKWIAKLLGDAPLDLPEGVPAAWLASAEKLLAPLDVVDGGQGRKGLAQDILGYLLQGSSPGVLAEVAQRPEVGQRLGLSYSGRGCEEDVLVGLYQPFNALPLDLAMRWARFIEAAARPQQAHCTLKLPNGARWPELLMLNSAGTAVNAYGGRRQPPRFLSCERLEAMLVEDGLRADALLVASFSEPVRPGYMSDDRLYLVSDLADYPAALARHLDTVRRLILPAEAAQRAHVLALLERAEPALLDALAPQLCDLGAAGSRQVRVAAEALLRRCGDAVFEPLRLMATGGKPEQRAQALRLLHLLGRSRELNGWVQWARDAAAADKAASVQALLAEWDAAAAPVAAVDDAALAHARPEIDWSGATNRPVPGVLEAIWRAVDAAVAAANARGREWQAAQAAQGRRYPFNEHPTEPAANRRALAEFLASDGRVPPERQNHVQQNWQFVGPALQAQAAAGALTPVALLKLLKAFDLLADSTGLLTPVASQAFDTLHRRNGRPTLLELSLMLDGVDVPGQGLVRSCCTAWGAGFAADWPAADVWPFVVQHIEFLVQVLVQNTIKGYAFDRAGLFRLLATLPAPHPLAVNALFAVALGPAKTERGPAQEALRHLPGKEQRIADALADGKAEVRTVAAQWLARLRHAPSLPALERAVAKEKNDLAKGALLDALQALGRPVEHYIDRQALATDAAKALTKGLPKELEGFPWESLPAVHWADTGEAVPRDTLRWLLVQAVKQKSPEPNAVLRKLCAMLEPAGREALGQFVLETWLREDTRPITADEALAKARQQAQSSHSFMTQYPQYAQGSPHLGKSVEELTALVLPAFLRQPMASAIGAKGLLAVAAACCAERAAAPVQRYLKEWYGTRAAQGKALIAMLAWIEHPSATQLMLAIGSRFRTRSFQEEATRQAEALAERKGWTLAELADRTIPSAGFDESGALELSYGARVFSAKLLPDFKVELFNPDGKKIAALPEPRMDDDAEQAKEAKKAFGAAKKELKSIVELQTDRLYEALCTGRDWPAADWADYLLRHPVLRHLVQRLVWLETGAEGTPPRAFRPLDDGTLTDADDNELTLAAGARVCLAHDSLMSAEAVAAWQRHLADYEIKPLFQQLGKGSYTLPPEKAQQDEVKDFEGHMLEAFALRGRALKLGYTRGATEDGGWFFVYEKRFATLGLVACIEFSGNGLPEENRSVALHHLSFAGTQAADRWQRAKLPLAQVPRVLLSECWHDLRLIAAEGSGFDPDWRKKSEP